MAETVLHICWEQGRKHGDEFNKEALLEEFNNLVLNEQWDDIINDDFARLPLMAKPSSKKLKSMKGPAKQFVVFGVALERDE